MNSVADMLEKARNKIAVYVCWLQGADAVDDQGNEVSVLSPRAIRWSAAGALECVIYQAYLCTSDARDAYDRAVDALAKGVPDEIRATVWSDAPEDCDLGIIRVNDTRSVDGHADHAAMLAMFDRAIEKAKA